MSFLRSSLYLALAQIGAKRYELYRAHVPMACACGSIYTLAFYLSLSLALPSQKRFVFLFPSTRAHDDDDDGRRSIESALLLSALLRARISLENPSIVPSNRSNRRDISRYCLNLASDRNHRKLDIPKHFSRCCKVARNISVNGLVIRRIAV